MPFLTMSRLFSCERCRKQTCLGRGSKLRKLGCLVYCVVVSCVNEDYLFGDVVDVVSHLLRGLDSLAAWPQLELLLLYFSLCVL